MSDPRYSIQQQIACLTTVENGFANGGMGKTMRKPEKDYTHNGVVAAKRSLQAVLKIWPEVEQLLRAKNEQ